MAEGSYAGRKSVHDTWEDFIIVECPGLLDAAGEGVPPNEGGAAIDVSTPSPTAQKPSQADMVQESKTELGDEEIVQMLTMKVAGSPGPLYIIFNENDTVEEVIKATLREYACQGRLPFLSSFNTNHYDLVPMILTNFVALDPKQTIVDWGHYPLIMWLKESEYEKPLPKKARSASRKTLHKLWSSAMSSVTKVH